MPFFGLTILGLYFFEYKSLAMGFFLFNLVTIFLTNYEFGINSKFDNQDLNLSAVIFFSKRKDQQVLISRQVDSADQKTFSYLTQNAANGKNYGFEFNSNFLLRERMLIYLNLGILKTQINNWESREDLENRSQAHAPERTFSAGINFDMSNNKSVSYTHLRAHETDS